MKRLTVFVLLLTVLVGGVLTTSATPLNELNAHAELYPQDTLMFVSVRTDDGYIEQLDGLLSRIRTFFPNDIPPMSMTDLLNEFALDSFDVDFTNGIRPWLGDKVSAGFFGDLMNASELPGLIAVDIQGKDQFLNFIETIVPDYEDFVTMETIGGYDVYTIPNEQVKVALSDTLLLIGLQENLPLNGLDASLASSATFNDAMASLPQSDYNISLYADVPALNQMNMQQSLNMMGDNAPDGFARLMERYNRLTGSMAMGFTVMDGNNYVIEVAQMPGDTDLEDFGFTTLVPDPVRPSFTANLPANTLFSIQGTDLGPAVINVIQSIVRFGELAEENGGIAQFLGISGGLSDSEMQQLESVDIPMIVNFARTTFRSFTNLDLEDDVLRWMDGDFALFITAQRHPETIIMPAFGMLADSSEAGAPRNVIAGLSEINFSSFDITAEPTNIDDADALVFTDLRTQSGLNDSALDIIIAGNDDLFGIGTRPAIEGVGTSSLVDTPNYAEASTLFLPGAQSIFYANLAPLGNFIDEAVAQGIIPAGQDAVALRNLVALLEHASITYRVDADGASVGRFVLTLGDTPPGN